MIQALLRHADLYTTKVYLQLVPGQLREGYDRAMPQMPVAVPPPPAMLAALVGPDNG